MSKPFLILLFLFLIPTSSQASFLTDNWLSREYREFRKYPRMDKAYKLIEARKYKEAIPLLQKVLEIDPLYKQAYISLIETCLSLKNYTCVIASSESWKQHAPKEQLAAYYLSFAYHHQNQHAKAIDNALEIVTTTITLDTENLSILLDILITELVETGRATEAVSWLSEFYTTDHLIRTSRVLDWSDQLVKEGFYKEGNQLLLQLPQKQRVIRARIVLLGKWGKTAEAASLLEAQLDPALRKHAKYWLYLAELYQESDNISGELHALHSGIRQVKDNRVLYHALLNRLIGLERLNESAELAQSMLRKQNDPELRQQLLDLLAATQDYDEAIKQVKIILQDASLNQRQLFEFRRELAYFLDKSNRQDELAELLSQDYEKSGNYRYLLQAEDKYRLLDEDVKRLQLLEKSFPFKNVPPSHRNYLILELIKLYLANNDTDKAKNTVIYLASKDQFSQELADSILVHLQLIDRPDLIRKLAEHQIQQGTATGYTYLAAAYCMQGLNKPGLALDYMEEARKRETSREEHRTLLKAMGYLAAEQYRVEDALNYWHGYLTEKFDSEIALRTALLALTSNHPEQAVPLLTQLGKQNLNPDQMAQYVFARGLVAEDKKRLPRAEVLFEMSLLLDSNDEVRHRLSTLTQKLDNPNETLIHLNELIIAQPNNSVFLAERGYVYNAMKKDEEAVTDFKASLELIPDRMTLTPEIAYALLRLGKRKEALEWFYRAVDEAPFFPVGENPELEDNRLFGLKRGLQSIEEQWGFQLASIVRLDKYQQQTDAVPPVAYASYQGFYSGELTYRLDTIPGGKQNGRITLYGRGLIGMQDQSLETIPDTLSLNIGLKYKLMQTKNLYLSAERLFGVGDAVSDDWMLRFQGGYALGNGFKPSLSNWLYLQSYADISYLTDQGIYYSLIEADVGYQFKVPIGASPGATISPYLSSQYTNNTGNADKQTVDRLDLGIGIGLYSWHLESNYRGFGLHNKLSLEGRTKISGNMEDNNTVHLKWELFF